MQLSSVVGGCRWWCGNGWCDTYDNGSSVTRMVITGHDVGIRTTAPFRKDFTFMPASINQMKTTEHSAIGDSTTNGHGVVWWSKLHPQATDSDIGSVRKSQAYHDLILNPKVGKVGIVCTAPA